MRLLLIGEAQLSRVEDAARVQSRLDLPQNAMRRPQRICQKRLADQADPVMVRDRRALLKSDTHGNLPDLIEPSGCGSGICLLAEQDHVE